MPLRRLLIPLLASLLLANVAGASTLAPVSWSGARALPLPANSTGSNGGVFNLLDCPTSTSCVAAGADALTSGAVRAVVAREVNGVWSTATLLRAPSGAAANPATNLLGLACTSLTTCVLTGSYADAHGNVHAFYQQSTNGTFAAPVTVALPAHALVTGQNAMLRDVVCPSSGNCSAIGSYLDNAAPIARLHTFTLDEQNGRWGHATILPVPSGANADPLAGASQLACASASNCVTVGSYVAVGGVGQAFVADEVNGTWRAPVTVALPANASAYPNANLSEVTCVVAGACTAVGTYLTTTGATVPLAVSETGGAWSRAQSIALPADAATNPETLFYGFGGVACPSAGHCVTGGQYVDATGNHQGFLATESNGTWSSVTLALPAGATQAGANGGVVSLACVSADECIAGAAFLDAHGNYQAGIATDVSGTWRGVTPVTLPSGATTVGLGGGVYSVVCSPTGVCQGVGTYENAAGNYPPFVIASR